MKFPYTLQTDGRGLWTREARPVDLTEITIREYYEGGRGGEMCVYFTRSSWNIGKYGLIYTDNTFLRDLRNALLFEGFSPTAVKSVDYSEQGMQGDDYVSLDVGKTFIDEWNYYLDWIDR